MNKEDREEDLKLEHPEDLQLVMGTKERAHWEQFLREEEESHVKSLANLELQELIIGHAKKRIEEEKEKFK